MSRLGEGRAPTAPGDCILSPEVVQLPKAGEVCVEHSDSEGTNVKPIEELDFRETPLGELVLRRRRSPSVPDEPVYEVKLDDEMLMSSTVNASERALAQPRPRTKERRAVRCTRRGPGAGVHSRRGARVRLRPSAGGRRIPGPGDRLALEPARADGRRATG